MKNAVALADGTVDHALSLSSLSAALFFFFKQKTAYEVVSCDWSSDVCSSDLSPVFYPGTVSEQDASAFVVTAGQETGNINIRMSLVPAARIEGVVLGVDGQSMTATPQVTLQRVSSFSQSTQSVRTFEGGRFQAV